MCIVVIPRTNDAYPIGALSAGTEVCLLEGTPGSGAQYGRSAGAKLVITRKWEETNAAACGHRRCAEGGGAYGKRARGGGGRALPVRRRAGEQRGLVGDAVAQVHDAGTAAGSAAA